MRYFIGFLIAILLIIVIIFLVFSGNSSKPRVTPRTLSSYSDTDATVSMTIDGPVNAPQNHTQVKVTVGRDSTLYQQFQGYDGDIVNSKSFPNTQNSYDVFLHALSHAGFTQGDKAQESANSAGFCPLGQVYTFEIVQNGDILQKYWSNSCGKPKTYRGNTDLTLTLFQAQVPDYNTLTQDINW